MNLVYSLPHHGFDTELQSASREHFADAGHTADAFVEKSAETVGVSKTTVHRALSNSGRISEDTRQKILKAARDLDYRPNNLARGLRSRKSATVGFIVTGLNTFYSSILEGAEELAVESGYSILLARSGGDPEREMMNLDILREKRVDGILVAPSHSRAGADYYRKLLDTGPPFVFFDRDLPGTEADCVMTDNFTGGLMAGRHLVSVGRTNIAFGCVSDIEMQSTSVKERLRGFRTALAEAGLSVGAMVGESRQGGGSHALFAAGAMVDYVQGGGKLDAVFAANDAAAVGIMTGLRRVGLVVPDDVAVVGFDGLGIASYLRPSLTTVRQPTKQMGMEAMRLLQESMTESNGARHRKRILLAPQLVVRESCGTRSFGDWDLTLEDDLPV